MNDYITAEGGSLFLCACDLNNRIRKEMLFKLNFAVTEDVQFIRPDKDGGKWKAKLKYSYDDSSCTLISPRFIFSFVLSEAESRERCMRNHEAEIKRMQIEHECLDMFDSQIIIPKYSEDKWQAYSMFCYPARKRHS